MLNDRDKELVLDLCNETNCGIHLALNALAFVKEHADVDITMLGYIKAKTLAVATPKLTFLERVKKFS